jgi:acetyltransferase-like isoleucine patch superfamily enzyme
MKQFASHGTGQVDRAQFAAIGANVIFEAGSMVFHPENILLGDNIYIGHYAILKGYFKNRMQIGNNVWIGQHCLLHSAGGLTIGNDVGIGPGVMITTARHKELGRDRSILFAELDMSPVVLGDECNIGVNAVILSGVRIGRGAQIGAGAVVVDDVPDFAIVAGVPARTLRFRPDETP